MYTVTPKQARRAATENDVSPAANHEHRPCMEPFYGPHQSGIETTPQAHTTLLAFDLSDDIDRETFVALMRIISDDAARLTQGQAPLGDLSATVAGNPARMTVTFGYGVKLLTKLGLESKLPHGSLEVPHHECDPQWSNADLLVQICADNELAVLQAQRTMSRNLRTHMEFRWVQRGFRPRPDSTAYPFGLDDGQRVQPGTHEFNRTVWAGNRTGAPHWFSGGTTLVVRRILTNTSQPNVPDNDAAPDRRGQTGTWRRGDQPGRAPDPAETIFQRNYRFEGEPAAFTPPETGLLLLSYQGRIDQFTAAKKHLTAPELQSDNATTIGSSVFLIPPGCEYGGWVGDRLLDE